MRGLLVLVLLLHPLFALAQSPHAVPTAWDSLRFGLANRGNSVWLSGQNAATLADWQSLGYGNTSLGATHTTGDFRRPQAPGQQTAYSLSSDGLRPVGGWLIHGSFAYQKTTDRQIAFSHGHDPFNGNPYLWADTLAGDWSRDHIRAQVSVASPRINRWRLGLSVPYHVGQGSRLLDPKPFYRVRELGVLPSVWRQVSARWGWGVVLGGQFTQEENEVGFYQVRTDNLLLYRLRGYGSFSRTPIVTAERLVTGTVWLGTLQSKWQRQQGTTTESWLLQVGGQQRQETIREGIAAPEAGGEFAETSVSGLLAYARTSTTRGSRYRLQADLRSGVGTDPILRTTGATYTLATVELAANRWQVQASGFRQQAARLEAGVMQYQDKIAVTDWSALRLSGGYDYQYRWTRQQETGWFAGASAGVRWIPARSFSALRPTRLTTILTEPDYRIQTTHAALLTATVGRDFRLARFGKLLHRLDGQLAGQFTMEASTRLTATLTYHLLYL